MIIPLTIVIAIVTIITLGVSLLLDSKTLGFCGAFGLALTTALIIDHNNMETPMHTETATFVPASTIFQDCDEARSQFNAADHGEASWGNDGQIHTLINQETFLAMLNDAELTDEDLKESTHPMKMQVLGQLNTIYSRLDTLGDSILIDLEQ